MKDNLEDAVDRLLKYHAMHVIGFGWRKTTEAFERERTRFMEEIHRIACGESRVQSDPDRQRTDDRPKDLGQG